MTSPSDAQRYAQEALFCERVLAKSGETVLSAALANVGTPTFWTHYPVGDVIDDESGAHWYYHSHANAPLRLGQPPEHGHFHCFVHPQGRTGPIHHLVALAVDDMGRLLRLFTVAQPVVNDVDLDPESRIALLPQFDLQLSHPNYLVNRWLTAVVALYQSDIADLIREGARRTLLEPGLEVTAELVVNLDAKARSFASV